MSIIDVKSLSFSYGRREVLRNLNFEIKKGSFVAIAGPNGAGKSTLINLLCGQLKSKSGSIHIDGAKIRSYSSKSLARKIAVVRQEFVPTFGFSVIETVLMARIAYYDAFGFEKSFDREAVTEALEATETKDFADRRLSQISGGERQRVFIARALAQDTPILLLDEPTSFLDLKHQVGIYDLLKKMQLEKGKTIVAVTHDINLAGQYCDEVLLLGADGNFHLGTAEEVFSQRTIESVFGIKTIQGQAQGRRFILPVGNTEKLKEADKNRLQS
jgi:iron complex transport system ATP-binding protein